MHTNPEYLYHYTTFENAKKIIDTNECWFTNVHFLNDSSEFNYARSIFEKTLNSPEGKERIFAALEPYGYLTSDLLPDILNEVENLLEEAKHGDSQSYIFSFSERGDQLSQWRGYGRNGDGVSIGFFI